MQDTKNLVVAAQARKVAVQIYRVTAAFPSLERFGLTAQMRRAAVSIGSNIAEGCGRRGARELVSYLYIAMGSASELEFQCELSQELGLGQPAPMQGVVVEVQRLKRMLARLIVALRSDTPRTRRAAPRETGSLQVVRRTDPPADRPTY